MTLGVENPLKARTHTAMDADKEFWHRRPIPHDALEYAALDVLLMLPTYAAIISWLSDADRILLRAYTNERIINMNAEVPPETLFKLGERMIPMYGVAPLDKVCGIQYIALMAREQDSRRSVCLLFFLKHWTYLRACLVGNGNQSGMGATCKTAAHEGPEAEG